jgi:hypothetical protein
MPSTTSSVVSALLASSTVMTPSLPTFSIAPRELADGLSPLARWCRPGRSPLVLGRLGRGLELAVDDRLDGLVDAALDLHRVVARGDELRALAVDRLGEHGGGGGAVAGGVEVFEATSRTIWAPMFSKRFSSSISLATVTPSLVTGGSRSSSRSRRCGPWGRG